MRDRIVRKLNQYAEKEKIHILLAVESGSRAWGMASPDSDYDIRAVYVRPLGHYLRIAESADTLDVMEDDWFDLGCWDIRKALRLLRKSNAVLLEWLNSPLVYQKDDAFVRDLKALVPQYAQTAPLLNHYRGIAGNALKSLDLHQAVPLKKWFYVLRPLLAARWAVQRGGVPPMTLAELMEGWRTDVLGEIRDLLAVKARQGEAYRHILPPVLVGATLDLHREVAALSAPAVRETDEEPLNGLFRATLQRMGADFAD
ncbi:MAG: nucleotidyltransferase domain-containing protein [Neisseria sp.]|nr:nucleotidyltransferase domain-containing protein [Neisseria sp.]